MNLANNGISWKYKDQPLKSKVYFPMLAADSVARCQIQGINQFNGAYSCPWCLSKGRNYKISERSHKWIFDSSEKIEFRNHTLFVQHLNELREKLYSNYPTSSHYGIKSASKLLCLPKFDIVKGFVFDYMHTALLGIARTMLFAWTDSKSNKKPYYIGNKLDEINGRISKCKIPAECQRIVRAISEIKFWKANEWKNWILLAVPILNGILPNCFLKHFSKFVRALSILNQDSITEGDLLKSTALIRKFCKLMPQLYDESFCSFNLHIFTHAVDCIKNWGPLWGYSLFQLENYNGFLCNSFSGTNQVPSQISRRILCAQKMYTLADSQFNCLVAKDFYQSLIHNQRLRKNSTKIGNATLLGSGKLYFFSDSEKKELIKIGLSHCQGLGFKSCIVSGKLYSTIYNSTKNRANYIIKSNNQYFIV